jgi:probable phosphoglycerate mutase
MTKIILARHGHVEGIKPERFRGRAELPLTSLGLAQAKSLAHRISTGWMPTIVYTSPMGRCVTTAEFIAQSCKATLQTLEGLNDLDYGLWQGRTHDQVRKARPMLLSAWYETPHLVRFPSGESLQDLFARTADALRLILDRHPGETVAAIGHDSVNRALLMQLIDQPLSSYWRIAQGPCCLNEIDIVDGKLRVSSINETYHLAKAD